MHEGQERGIKHPLLLSTDMSFHIDQLSAWKINEHAWLILVYAAKAGNASTGSTQNAQPPVLQTVQLAMMVLVYEGEV